MSVEKAKQFLVEVADDDDLSERIDTAYLAALREVAGEQGYELSDEDLGVALVEMSGLGDDLDEVEGFALLDSLGGGFLAPSPLFKPVRFDSRISRSGFNTRRPRFGR